MRVSKWIIPTSSIRKEEQRENGINRKRKPTESGGPSCQGERRYADDRSGKACRADT